jgi:DASS family divalent anion:Na+ symporter
VTPQAWQLLSIFLSTIAGLVLGPLPVGAWAFLGLTATVATRTLPFTAAFGAFTNEVIWLIVISFFFARGFVKTGLGDRVATYFVKWLGGSTLGLSYGLTISEACIAPAMPSTTARAGGVFLPIVKSLSLSAGSKPNDPSAKKLGAYLVQSQLQVNNNLLELILHSNYECKLLQMNHGNLGGAFSPNAYKFCSTQGNPLRAKSLFCFSYPTGLSTIALYLYITFASHG